MRVAKQYSAVLRPAARRDLDRLPSQIRDKFVTALLKLEKDPKPRASKQLMSRGRERRLRVGAYRVLHEYEVDDKAAVVRIFRVRHRREACR